MRIFYFTSVNLSDCEPGAKSHIENILAGLHKLNWKITLFSSGNKRQCQPNFPFCHRQVKKQNSSLAEWIKEQIRLFWLLVTTGEKMPDIVYIRTSPLFIVPVLFSVFKKIPFCLEMNAAMNLGSSRKRRVKIAQVVENWALRRSKAVITTTEELKAYFSLRASFGKGKIHVVPMGFESDLFHSPATETRPPENKSFTIGFLGQFHKRQGIADLINSVPLVLEKHKNVRFEIAGRGGIEPELKRQVERLGVGEYVNFIGFLENKSIRGFLNRCDLTTAPYFGGFNHNIPMGSPTKIFIYLAGRKPVLTTRLPSLDLFKPCKAVFFADPDDPQDLARGIVEQIRKTPAQRYELGRAGYDFVNKGFTWEILSKKTSSILENTLNLKTDSNR